MSARCISFSLALILLPVAVALAEIKTEKISLEDVPAEAKAGADKVEPGSKWSSAQKQSNEASSVKVWYRLLGKVELRAAKEKVTSDGDVEVIPGDVRNLEVRVKPDGGLIDIVMDLPAEEIPKVILEALKKESDLEPQFARSVRTTVKGKPYSYVVWLDANGFLKYLVSADGKKVEQLQGK